MVAGVSQGQAVAPTPVSPGQECAAKVGAVLAFGLFLGLYGYAEWLEHQRIKRGYKGLHNSEDDVEQPNGKVPNGHTATPQSPTNGAAAGAPQHFSYLGCGFARCLLLDEQALLDARLNLRAAVEFGSIMLWYYLADRTTTFPRGIKEYSRDVMAFIFATLTVVAAWTSTKKARAPVLLNRQQTEEWKGWMQVLFLLYHYFNAREIYNAIRVFIAGYVWMTGFGNFSYYYKTKDFCLGRFMAMMWRLNFLVAVTCVVLQNSYMLYYICPMHTLFTIMVYAALGIAPQYNQSHTGILIKIAACFAVVFVCWDLKAVFYTIWGPLTFLMGYSDPRKPTNDLLHEWHFRSSLDRYVWIHGMICAYIHPWCEAALHKVDAMALRARLAVRAAIVTVTVTVFAVWYQTVYVLPKLEYNALHPYTSWIPISCWAVLRNLTPGLRNYSLGLFGWLGCITLETYIGQFHTWLLTDVPDGQPKLLLNFLPAAYPLLNFGLASAVYVYVSYRLFQLTNVLRIAVIPAKAGAELLRNAIIIAACTGALVAAGALLLRLQLLGQ